MTPSELYQAGKLDEAVAAALEGVKKHPTDTSRRGQLSELLMFAGDLERADKQLETMLHQDPSTVMGVGLLRQLIRAETARQQFIADGRLPEFVGGAPTETLKLHLQASISLREGKMEEATQLLEQAEASRPKVSGNVDGQPFTDFRDLDDTTASFFEVITSNGKYYWIPIESVEFIDFRKPERPKDLLYRQAHMVVQGGPDGEVYLPTLYVGTHTLDDQLRLGRGTEWRGGEDGSPVRGAGLRMFLVGDEDRSILQMGKIEFDGDF
jgi:type VI secretion system protein ImpE